MEDETGQYSTSRDLARILIPDTRPSGSSDVDEEVIVWHLHRYSIVQHRHDIVMDSTSIKYCLAWH
jgi:hypothetical protein